MAVRACALDDHPVICAHAAGGLLAREQAASAVGQTVGSGALIEQVQQVLDTLSVCVRDVCILLTAGLLGATTTGSTASKRCSNSGVLQQQQQQYHICWAVLVSYRLYCSKTPPPCFCSWPTCAHMRRHMT
jgi:hypothetical protein